MIISKYNQQTGILETEFTEDVILEEINKLYHFNKRK